MNLKVCRGWGSVAIFGALLLFGCAGMRVPSTGKSLYERLGGQSAIVAVVDRLVVSILSDSRINGRFATTNIPKLKGHLIAQVCMASGGPCLYKGRDMKATHAGMKITPNDFGALVEDLVSALTQLKVPAQEKGELLVLLTAMKQEIVE